MAPLHKSLVPAVPIGPFIMAYHMLLSNVCFGIVPNSYSSQANIEISFVQEIMLLQAGFNRQCNGTDAIKIIAKKYGLYDGVLLQLLAKLLIAHIKVKQSVPAPSL